MNLIESITFFYKFSDKFEVRLKSSNNQLISMSLKDLYFAILKKYASEHFIRLKRIKICLEIFQYKLK